MKLSSVLWCYRRSFSLFCLVVIARTDKNCPRPDAPVDGKYTPQRAKYLPGDEVTYMCKDGYILAGDDTRICNSSGTWSDKPPFCESFLLYREMNMKILRGHISLLPSSISNVMDGRNKTCPSWGICAGCHLQLEVEEAVMVKDIRIELKESGTAPIRIETFLDNSGEKCDDYHGQIVSAESQWITIKCKQNLFRSINIVNRANEDILICKIQVLRKYQGTFHDIELNYIRGNIYLLHEPTSGIIDGNNITCLSWRICPGCLLQLVVEKQAVARAFRIFLKAKDAPFNRIEIFLNNNGRICAVYHGHSKTSQWIVMQCPNNSTLTNVISIENTAETDTTICEIQVFGVNENDCEHPPELRISNGYFEVSRNKSTLICEDGYKSKNGSLICSENSWKSFGPKCDENLCDPLVFNSSLTPNGEWLFLDPGKTLSAGTSRQLKCNTGYDMVGGPDKVSCLKNGLWSETNAACIETKKIIPIVIGGVVALLVITILILAGIIIYMKRKQRNRHNEAVNNANDDSVAPESEPEYATIDYEELDRLQSMEPRLYLTMGPISAPDSDTYILPN